MRPSPRAGTLAAAAALLLAWALPAHAEPRTIRVQKGLPGLWPGVALVPEQAEALGFLRLDAVRAWLDGQGQGGSKGFDELLDDLGQDLSRDSGLPMGELRSRARSLVFAVAGRATRPLGDGLAGILIFAGSFDERSLAAKLGRDSDVVAVVGGHKIFARHASAKDGEGLCVIPGGLIYGNLSWLEQALRRVDDPAQRRDGPAAGLARTRVATGQASFAWLTVVPSAATRGQLAPIKHFIGSLDGLVIAATHADRDLRARLTMRLGFHTSAEANEASAFIQQILSLAFLSAQGRGGLQGVIGGVMASLSTSLHVEGADVVGEITR